MKLSRIEPLEVRVAPATLVNPTTVVFHDLDGDDVTIKFSKGLFAGPGGLANANAVFHFNTGDIDTDATNDTPQQLQLIDLTDQAATAAGLGITVTAKHSTTRGGDGFADVGYVNATGIDLGIVSISGDLGGINAGSPAANSTPAIKSLTVQSMGQLGTSTQGASPSLASTFNGALPSLTVKGHVRDVSLTTTGGDSSEIGVVTIGGSDFGANIVSAGKISTVKIGGSLFGGTAVGTGRISAAHAIDSVTIGGSVIGTLDNTAVIIANSATGHIKSVRIGGDLRGGTGVNSGRIETTDQHTTIATVSIGGSIVGGGDNSGMVYAYGDLGTATIGGDLRGGAGLNSGGIEAYYFKIGTLSIKGSLIGGAGDDSGRVHADAGFTSVTVGGSVLGGSGEASATIASDDNCGTVTVMGSVIGYVGSLANGGEDGARISADLFKSVTIGGSLRGGKADSSGQIAGTYDGIEGNVTIGGSIEGGGGQYSGSIQATGLGGVAKIGVDLRGGAGFGSGSIMISDYLLGGVTIGGSVIAGSEDRTGMISAYEGIKTITVKGSLIGTAAHKVVISSQYDDFSVRNKDLPTLGTINIGGRVEYAEILAGYIGTSPSNPDAKIGSVTVGGDWIASSIAAGVRSGPAGTGDGKFGTADDTINTGIAHRDKSRIGSVVIKGQALGTPATVSSTDFFGIVAEEIGMLKVGNVSYKLTVGQVDGVALGATGDFIAREDVLPGQFATIASPAAITALKTVSPTKFTYTDVDGDLVTITTTKAILLDADIIRVNAGLGLQVQEIKLANHVAAANNGVGLTITAVPQKFSIVNGNVTTDYILGDGSVNIGYVNATGLDLGAMKIAGDLGRLEAGDAVLTTKSLTTLSAQSIGLFGLGTQASGASLHSHLKGPVTSITVRGDVLDAVLDISGEGMTAAFDQGDLGSLTINGSLRAGADLMGDVEGAVTATGKIGALTIGHDVVGGAGDNSGRITARNTIGAVKLGGFLQGGAAAAAGAGSGAVVSQIGITSATIGGDIRGGTKDGSGLLDGAKSLGAVTIKGSMIGGDGEDSGSVIAEALSAKITSVNVAGDIRGGGGKESAYIHAKVTIGTVTIGGSLIGGDGQMSALIYAGSSILEPHKISSVTIGGDLRGGLGQNSANIGSASAQAGATESIDVSSITIKGSIVGGPGIDSAAITVNNLPKLSVGGSVLGGSAAGAGKVALSGALGSLTIGGSLEGGAASFTGFLSAQKVTTLTVTHDVRGGAGNGAGSVFFNLGGATTMTVNGSIFSGSGADTGLLDVNGPLGSLTIGGSVFGTAAKHVQIQARGMDMKSTPPALGRLTIKGSADYLDVFGGRLNAGITQNGDANIGSITVTGEWIAGNIAAGANPGPGGQFGDDGDSNSVFGNNADFHAKIASIVIKGRGMGTVGGNDQFGIVAEEIASLTIGSLKIPLLAKANNDRGTRPDPFQLNLGPTGDFAVREVPAVM